MIKTSILTAGVNNHPTTSEEANYFATDFVNDGVLGTVGNTSGVAPMSGGLGVNASAGMILAVTVGVAYITTAPSTQRAQVIRSEMTVSENVTIQANATGGTRYDWIYLKHDPVKANAPDLAGDDVGSIYTSRSTSSVTDTNAPPSYGTLLAVVTVPNGAASISNSQISDRRTAASLDIATSGVVGGWNPFTVVPTTVTGYNRGQKDQDVRFAGVDLTGVISKGNRFKVDRTGSTPSQSSDLENTSSQYAVKNTPSGIAFTDDATAEAWIKLESYPTSQAQIISKYNGTSGWNFYIDSVGRVVFSGNNGGAANFRFTRSYQALPLGQWIHIAACLDMSGFSAATNPIYINGASVPVEIGQGGTNPTALIQAGNLELGSTNTGTLLFDGKLAEVRVFNVIRTATQIRDNMNIQITPDATCVAYFPLNGNFNDSSSNANNLTAVNGAIATSAENPFKQTEYALITNVTYSAPDTIVSLFTGTDHNIPLATLQNAYYSREDSPLNFPRERGKWIVEAYLRHNLTVGIGALGTTYYSNYSVVAPIGAFTVEPIIPHIEGTSTTTGTGNDNTVMGFICDSTTVFSVVEPLNSYARSSNSSQSWGAVSTLVGTAPRIFTSQGVLALWIRMPTYTGGAATAFVTGSDAPAVIRLRSAYV